ncbi:MAG: hypothetical protein ABSC88_12350 [Terracidiphilus sp.]
MIIDAESKIGQLGSILFRFFAIFSYRISVQPCYNPFEIHFSSPRISCVETGNRIK